MSLRRHQQIFFDVTVHHPNVKQCISSKYEFEFKKVLSAIGKEGKDWFHQQEFCSEDDGLVAVADFAFPKEGLIVELDDPGHRQKTHRQNDIERDRAFFHNDFAVIRIKVPIPINKLPYWKVYIEQTLKYLRENPPEKTKKRKTRKRLFTDKEFEDRMRMSMAES